MKVSWLSVKTKVKINEEIIYHRVIFARNKKIWLLVKEGNNINTRFMLPFFANTWAMEFTNYVKQEIIDVEKGRMIWNRLMVFYDFERG